MSSTIDHDRLREAFASMRVSPDNLVAWAELALRDTLMDTMSSDLAGHGEFIQGERGKDSIQLDGYFTSTELVALAILMKDKK